MSTPQIPTLGEWAELQPGRYKCPVTGACARVNHPPEEFQHVPAVVIDRYEIFAKNLREDYADIRRHEKSRRDAGDPSRVFIPGEGRGLLVVGADDEIRQAYAVSDRMGQRAVNVAHVLDGRRATWTKTDRAWVVDLRGAGHTIQTCHRQVNGRHPGRNPDRPDGGAFRTRTTTGRGWLLYVWGVRDARPGLTS